MKHKHCCQHCGLDYECSGRLEQNYDGFPETACTVVQGFGIPALCEECAELPWCRWCGEIIDGRAIGYGENTACSRRCYEVLRYGDTHVETAAEGQ